MWREHLHRRPRSAQCFYGLHKFRQLKTIGREDGDFA
jgi:hypothetical protein